MSIATKPEITNRTATLDTRSADAVDQTIDAVIASERPTVVYDSRYRKLISEVLVAAGAELPATVPLFEDHQRQVAATVGSCRGLRREGTQIVGRLHFGRDERSQRCFSLVRDKHLTDVSVGYEASEFVDIAPGDSATVNGKRYSAGSNLTLRVTTKWKIREVSVVPIGADPNAKTRSSITQGDHDVRTSVSSLIGRELAGMTIADFARVILQRRGGEMPQNDLALCRAAFSGVDGLDELVGVVNSAVLGGFADAADTTDGWVRRVPLPNYLQTQLAAVDRAPRIEQAPRGGVATAVDFRVAGDGWRLVRFGARFTLDEQDILDAAPINAMQLAMEEVGRAARRLLPDAVYSFVLENPTIGDDVALFDATRGNVGTAALADSSLDAGMAAIGEQTMLDTEGRAVHLGLSGRYLIVPPALQGLGKRLARDMATGDGDLVVRSESRLGTAGVLNPITNELRSGTATNWLLAAPADQGGGIVVGHLDGQERPDVSHFPLKLGQWGVGFDVKFSLAVGALGGRPLYWSDGTVS